VHGVSTRKVEDLVAVLDLEFGISQSEVNRICWELDEQLGAFRSPSLARMGLPYVFLDATYLKGRVDQRVVSREVVVATGVSMDRNPEALGLCRRPLRGRGRLDRVPAVPAGPKAQRSPPGHL
jgi:putative transposase